MQDTFNQELSRLCEQTYRAVLADRPFLRPLQAGIPGKSTLADRHSITVSKPHLDEVLARRATFWAVWRSIQVIKPDVPCIPFREAALAHCMPTFESEYVARLEEVVT